MTKPNISPTSRRTSKGFTLLELIVVVVTLGVLALIAVPSFTGVISSSTGATASNTASAVARDAKALAAFNTGSNVNVVSNANVDAAIGELALNTADGWTVDTSASDGASLSLSKNGKDCEVAITVTAGVVTAGDAVCANAAGGGGGGGGAYYVNYTTGNAYTTGVYNIPLNTIIYDETANTLAMTVPSNITTSSCGTWPASVTFLQVRADNGDSPFRTFVSNPSTVNNGDGTSTITFDLETAQVGDGLGNVVTQPLTNARDQIYQVNSLSCIWSTRFGF